jgi:hypothetical protein
MDPSQVMCLLLPLLLLLLLPLLLPRAEMVVQ